MRIKNIIFVEIKLYYVIIFYYSYFSILGRIFKKLKIALKEHFDDLEKSAKGGLNRSEIIC